MKIKPARIVADLAIPTLLIIAFRWHPACGWGYAEALAVLAVPFFYFSVPTKRPFLRAWGLTILAALGVLSWMPETLEIMGGLPPLGAWGGLVAYSLWKALGLALAAKAGHLGHRWRGPLAAAFCAAFAWVLWERFAFNIYVWSWGAPLGALPFMARSAAFVGSLGVGALAWGVGTWAGLRYAAGIRNRATWLPLAALPTLLILLGAAWYLLPKGPTRTLDLVLIQPNHDPGVRRGPVMEAEGWAMTDPVLTREGLPKADAATLLLWAESSVLGRDDRFPNARLASEAVRRRVAWMFGTEGGHMNLVRGEVAGRPPFLMGKVELMPFGERMPGPAPLREWLDQKMGIVSQVPGTLGPHSSFVIPTPQGELKAHPLICSEALLAPRVFDGLAAAGGDLLTNHTNDGWFGTSVATDGHASLIRLRAVETGLPLVRTTLTGKSGLFFADGRWELWGEPRSQDTYVHRLTWQVVQTPIRQGWVRTLLFLALVAGTVWTLVRKDKSALQNA